jgi:transposase InsO family protein
VAAVVDLLSRRVVGWSMNAAMTAQLVTDARVMAIRRRGKPNALLHHSDRGSQNTSEQFPAVDGRSRRILPCIGQRWRFMSGTSAPSLGDCDDFLGLFS